MKQHDLYRNDIFEYAKEKFKTTPEYLWKKYPGHAVLRHKENLKWYALIINISKQKLGLQGKEKVDILNVKCDPLMIGSLLQNEGCLPAYHMNKEHWITVLLDGSISKNSVFDLLSLSFDLTS